MRVLVGSMLLLLACKKDAPPSDPPSVLDLTVQTIDGPQSPFKTTRAGCC